MHRTISLLIAGGAVALAAAMPAQASPIRPDPGTSQLLTLVAQGCGPSGWRGPYGHCRYTPYRGGYYGPPPIVAPVGRVWVPAHYGPAGRWFPGHWAVR